MNKHMIKKDIIEKENLILSDIHAKYGIEYRNAVFRNELFYASFPYFTSLESLNIILLKIINAYYRDSGNIRFKFVYADDKYVSMIINNFYAINYSIYDQALLPASLLLNEIGIKKHNVVKASRKIDKRGKVLFDTLRLAKGGIRVDVADPARLENYTLKVSALKK